ncbi:MAG: hypothetical protein LGR52_05650 [Candidatus Thiosymbion ectosymbiont of Robbea hypermnestra]|nr:hypothetical protein [Candidatus Thiosymbion ectosymbiont of Robbea hypermnestra]
MSDHCTFDDALPRAVVLVQHRFPGIELEDCRFVRDMNGRLFVVVPDGVDEGDLALARPELTQVLGAYSPSVDGGLARFRDTLAGDVLKYEPALVHDIAGSKVWLVERRVVGQDWAQAPEQAGKHPPRVAFFSLKGGVGRSTALFLWGRHLASQGWTVLLIDLDLEAPGLGAQLLPQADRPEFGVLDWLVEDLVDNPLAERMAERMVARTPLSEQPGLYVAPATGHAIDRYPVGFTAKLARGYLEGGGIGSGSRFANRVRRLCGLLENQVGPDLVLIDSRAGLHETAAATVLHLDADVLLFATDQPAVWEGYRYLLAQLGPMARSFRGRRDDDWRLRFKMVHAKASEAQRDLDHYLGHSYELWVNGLYDEDPPGSDEERFTFSIGDEAAPHYPLTILADPRFERFNPLDDLTQVGEMAITASFGAFTTGLEQRILGEADGG